MESLSLKKNWLGFILVAVIFTGTALLSCWFITWPAIKATQLNQPLPGDWTWFSIVMVDLLVIAGAGYITLETLFQYLTSFTEEGIKQPNIIGRATVVPWKDIVQVEVTRLAKQPYAIYLYTATNRIIVKWGYYKEPNELLNIINRYVQPSAMPSS